MHQIGIPWSEDEVKVLVKYVRCKGFSSSWPAVKQSEFWESSAAFIASCVLDHSRRTGM